MWGFSSIFTWKNTAAIACCNDVSKLIANRVFFENFSFPSKLKISKTIDFCYCRRGYNFVWLQITMILPQSLVKSDKLVKRSEHLKLATFAWNMTVRHFRQFLEVLCLFTLWRFRVWSCIKIHVFSSILTRTKNIIGYRILKNETFIVFFVQSYQKSWVFLDFYFFFSVKNLENYWFLLMSKGGITSSDFKQRWFCRKVWWNQINW